MKNLKQTILTILVITMMTFVLMPFTPVKAENKYNLRIGETQVTEENKDDILGDGKAKYDPETGILTLNDLVISGAIYAEGFDLIVRGKAELTAAEYGIRVSGGNLTVADEDTDIKINVYNSSGAYGMKAGGMISIEDGNISITAASKRDTLCYAYGLSADTVAISGGTVDVNVVEGYDSIGIEGYAVISGGDVTLKSKGLYAYGISEEGFLMTDGKLYIENESEEYGDGIMALYSSAKITITGGELTVNTKNNGGDTVGISALSASGGVLISGGKIDLTVSALEDSLNDGISSWNMSGPGEGIIISGGDVSINVSGKSSSSSSIGIYTDKSVTISGGKLYSKAGDIGISAEGVIRIENGIESVEAHGGNGQSGIYSLKSLVLGNELTIVDPKNGKIRDDLKTIVKSNGDKAIDVKIVNDNKYTITVEESTNGQVSASRTKANGGDPVYLTVTPDTDCELDSLTVLDSQGETVVLTPTDDGYEFTMPEDDVTVSAEFIRYYTIGVAEGSEVYIDTLSRERAPAGAEITVKLKEVEGYVTKGIRVKDAGGNEIAVSDDIFIMPAANVTVTVLAARLHAITVEESTDGSVTADKQVAEAGEKVVLTVAPEESCELDSLTVLDSQGEVALTLTEDGYEFTMPEDDVTISAQFIRYYDIRIPEESAVFVEADHEKAAAGDTVRLTLNKVEKYVIRGVQVTDAEGKAIEVSEDNTFIMPASEVTVIADAVKLCTITFDLNGGTYNGKNTYTVIYTEGTAISLPEPSRNGYVFEYWEGSKYYAGDSYTVMEDHVFKAIWKVKEDSKSAKTVTYKVPITGIDH